MNMKNITSLRTDRRTQDVLLAMLDAITSLRTELIALQADRASLVLGLQNMAFTDPGCAIGTTVTTVKTAATCTFAIGGIFYSKAATDDFWALTGFDCANALYNKCLLCINAAGTASIVAGVAAATAAGVTFPAISDAVTVIGLLQVHPTGTGGFVGGTTGLADVTVVPNAVYTDRSVSAERFVATTAAPDEIGVTR